VEATDLQGGYPELQSHLAGLKAEVDRHGKLVSVSFDPSLPPRLAAVRGGGGCQQMPIGASSVSYHDHSTEIQEAVANTEAWRARFDAETWPLGDLNAAVDARGIARFDAILDAALSDRYGKDTRTSALLIVNDGGIIAERYAWGIGIHTPQRTWSVAKSLTAALIGRAKALHLVDVDASPRSPTRWLLDRRSTISIDQLLRMQSGLWTDGPGSRTDALYFGGATVLETAAVAPVEVAPGTRFHYSNNDTLLAALALPAEPYLPPPAVYPSQLVRPHHGDFATTQLLGPAGMTRTTIETDWQGNPILSSQVWMTARDLARLALLHLNDGQVPDGKGGMRRLLPEGWVRDATTPVGPQPAGDMGYGRAIWLMGPKQGLPAGSYAFLGNRGQMAIIVPAAQLIVVRRGFDPHGTRFDGAALARDILAALATPSPVPANAPR